MTRQSWYDYKISRKRARMYGSHYDDELMSYIGGGVFPVFSFIAGVGSGHLLEWLLIGISATCLSVARGLKNHQRGEELLAHEAGFVYPYEQYRQLREEEGLPCLRKKDYNDLLRKVRKEFRARYWKHVYD